MDASKSAKKHPFQVKVQGKDPPRGSYEARKVKNGLYVRVDMPGVTDADGVKLSTEGRKVTFSAIAPKLWDWDTERVYGGCLNLDQDAETLEISKTLENGSLHLFIPGADSSFQAEEPHPLQPCRGTKQRVDDTIQAIAGTEWTVCRICSCLGSYALNQAAEGAPNFL